MTNTGGMDAGLQTKRRPIEWKGQVVITTALLAGVYGANEQQIQQNFNNHKDNFVEGKRYILLQGEELRDFKDRFDNIELVGKRASQLYLWTERGANRHCKILDTDKAREQFDNLEETYFRSRQATIDLEQLDPQTKLMNLLVQSISQNEIEQKRLAGQVAARERAIGGIREAVMPVTDNWREEMQKKFNRVQRSSGIDFRSLWSEMYAELDRRAGADIGTRLRNRKERMRSEGYTKTAVSSLNKMDIVESDKRLREIFAKIMDEYEIRYCA